MIKNYITILTFCFSALAFSQITYNGNGNTGFGGPIGPSSLQISDDGTTINFTFTKGPGDFNDALVIYIDTGVTGRTTIDGDVNDQGDDLRRAISSAGADASVINFAGGFQASHAIAVSVNMFANFAGIWSIPTTTVGDNDLAFVSSANLPMGTTPTTASFTFSVTWANLGLTSTGSTAFDFVATYLNAGNGFSSNEGYGDGLPMANVGSDPITFTNFLTYDQALSTPQLETTDLRAFVNNKTLTVNGFNNMGSISIFNLLGQSVFKVENVFIDDSSRFNLPVTRQGVYLVRVNSQQDVSKMFKLYID